MPEVMSLPMSLVTALCVQNPCSADCIIPWPYAPSEPKSPTLCNHKTMWLMDSDWMDINWWRDNDSFQFWMPWQDFLCIHLKKKWKKTKQTNKRTNKKPYENLETLIVIMWYSSSVRQNVRFFAKFGNWLCETISITFMIVCILTPSLSTPPMFWYQRIWIYEFGGRCLFN